MTEQQREQAKILIAISNDGRLTPSARRQVEIFQQLLGADDSIGFDTTSALFFGFLHNDEFVQPDVCPLSQKQIREAKAICLAEARRSTAKSVTLLSRIARLPLSGVFGERIDLRDLAISFLTYASDEPHFAFDHRRARRLYEYLDIPSTY